MSNNWEWEQADEKANQIRQEIENYILFYTSDEEERQKMLKVLNDFMDEVYEF